MKKYLLIILLFPYLTNAQGRFNSTADLKLTVQDFLSALYSQSIFSDTAYTVTVNNLIASGSLNDNAVARVLTVSMDRNNRFFIKNNLNSARLDAFQYYKILDTIVTKDEYMGTEFNMTYLYVKFTKAKDANLYYKHPDQIIYLFRFARLQSQLLLIDITEAAHDRYLQERIYSDESIANNLMDKKFPLVFEEFLQLTDQDRWSLTTLPFRSQSKWGLKALNDSILFPATADTLYPEAGKKWMICIKNKKNLIDENFKTHFASDVQLLVRGDYYFFSPTDDNGAARSAFSPEYYAEKLPVMKPGVTYYRSLTSYLVSADAKVYKPVTIYHVQKVTSEGMVSDDLTKAGTYGYSSLDEKYELAEKVEIDHSITYILLNELGKPPVEFKGYSEMSLVNNKLYAKKNDSTYIFSDDGSLEFSSAFESHYNVQRDNSQVILYDRSIGLYGLYLANSKLYLEPRYRSITVSDHEEPYFMVVTEDYNYGFITPDGKEFFD